MTMTLSGDGTITGLVAGGLPDATVTADDLAAGAALNNAPNSVGFRNRIINGDMRIDQRNAGASVTLTTGTSYPVDRWRCDEVSDGGATGEQVQDAPAGFVDSLKITTTTADGTLSAAQYMAANQFVEGFNTADFGWGTVNAKTVTLSFWVKSSLTGTFAAGIDNNAGNRSYVFNYTISVADTWEYKTITIAGDTSGTWNTTNARGLGLRFGLGSGTDFDGTVGAWQSSSKFSSSGAVSVIGTLNATWFITGVQLEVGSVATPFERRPYGTELALCQRYCYQAIGRDVGSTSSDWAGGGFSASTTFSLTPINLPVTMRSASGQSLVLSSSVGNYRALNGAGSGINATAVVLDTPSVRCPVIGVTVASGLTVGQGSAFYVDSSAHKAFITSEL
jgi:hypothetical protein